MAHTPSANQSAPDATRRSERSRRAIYDAALALVVEVGYPRTTIEGIAARAGVGKQTIYRWWGSKADVLLEAFLDLGEQAARAAGHLSYAIPDTGDLAADLKQVLRATVDELRDPAFEAPSRALAAEGVVNEELGRRFVAQLLEPPLQLYVDRLRAAQQAGDVRADVDPRIALELFVSPLAQRWLQYTGPI
ncbi:TetR family transcriptional regulator, partial [Streptomyces sp. SID7804]